MREIINLQVGNCGNKVSTSFWASILKEHGIESNGSYTGNSDLQLKNINTYFDEAKENHYLPRATLIDLEPTAIDQIHASPLGSLFIPDNCLVGRGGASQNFARGFHIEGREWADVALDKIRKQAEKCDRLQGFQMVYSLGGGTGSGMGSLIASKLKEEYPDSMIHAYPVFPSDKVSDIIVEPYNTVLACNYLREYADMVQVTSNEALYNICFRNLKTTELNYSDLNRIVGEAMNALTCTYRFPAELNNTMRKTAMNFVPFFKLPFLMAGFSEISPPNDDLYWPDSSFYHVTYRAFASKYCICDADPRHGRILSASMVFRGKGSLKEVDESAFRIYNRGSPYLVEWICDNLKACLCEIPQSDWGLSCVLNSNSTAVYEVFEGILEGFRGIFRRKAFLHRYIGEGMDEAEFIHAEDNIQDIISEYRRFQDATAEDEEDDNAYGYDENY